MSRRRRPSQTWPQSRLLLKSTRLLDTFLLFGVYRLLNRRLLSRILTNGIGNVNRPRVVSTGVTETTWIHDRSTTIRCGLWFPYLFSPIVELMLTSMRNTTSSVRPLHLDVLCRRGSTLCHRGHVDVLDPNILLFDFARVSGWFACNCGKHPQQLHRYGCEYGLRLDRIGSDLSSVWRTSM